MEPKRSSKHPWDLPLPRAPILRPTWKRGQDDDTAVRISMPEKPPSHEVELEIDRLVPSKRAYFKAFDATEAQDAALADRTVQYDHDLQQHDLTDAKKRRDSIQDDRCPSADSVAEASSLSSSPRLPPKPRPQPPAIVLTTEASPSSDDSNAQVPKELEIDGNAGFDPHRTENATPPKRTYLYQGRRYEVQGDEPEEWLKDVREVAPAPRQVSVSSTRARNRSRSSITPSSMRSGTTPRRRQSRRESSDRPDDHERRRSGRRR